MTDAPTLLGELLADCDAVGIRLLLADDGGLTIDAPQDALTPDLMDRLRANKGPLQDLLAGLTPADSAGDPDTAEEPPLGPDGWPTDCIDPTSLTPCLICGGLMQWQSLAGC